MLTSNFLLLLVSIFAFGFISEYRTYRKFTDQSDPCVDDIVKDFKLLDDWLIEF